MCLSIHIDDYYPRFTSSTATYAVVHRYPRTTLNKISIYFARLARVESMYRYIDSIFDWCSDTSVPLLFIKTLRASLPINYQPQESPVLVQCINNRNSVFFPLFSRNACIELSIYGSRCRLLKTYASFSHLNGKRGGISIFPHSY